MELNEALGRALRDLRTSRGISQEGVGASQSYVSDVERGLKSLSIEKLDEFASAIGIHPVTILMKCYMNVKPDETAEDVMSRVMTELSPI